MGKMGLQLAAGARRGSGAPSEGASGRKLSLGTAVLTVHGAS